MKISIIICTHNHLDSLKKTIEALKEIRVPAPEETELLIVENASTDGTAEFIETVQLPNMSSRPLHEPAKGQVRARNKGLSAAQGEYIFFTDDDIRPSVDWLEKMCARLDSGEFGAVAGAVQLAPHLERPWMTRRLKASLAVTEGLEDGWLTEMVGANMAFHRRVLSRVPGFDEELGPGALGFGDDSLFSWQLLEAGFRIGRAPEAVVEHHFDTSRLLRASLLESARRNGRSNAYLRHHWKHEKISWPLFRLAVTYLKIARRRLISRKDMQRTEGCAEWEMSLTAEEWRYRYFITERRRPRHYARRGLVKLHPAGREGALPADIPVTAST